MRCCFLQSCISQVILKLHQTTQSYHLETLSIFYRFPVDVKLNLEPLELVLVAKIFKNRRKLKD